MIRIIIMSMLAIFFVGCSEFSEEKISEKKLKKTPHDFMFMQRAYPTGELKMDAYAKAVQWKKEKLQQRSAVVGVWELAGPTNIGGRITDIEIPIDDGNTYYVGAASGGIFKTSDSGTNWTPIFDDQEMLSIGDIEISKNDTDVLWVGTGEVNAGGGSLAYDGDGIYKSEDGGLTWDSKGLPNVGSIGKILIDPNDENTIFVGAMGPLFRDDNNRGVYRSTDGGTTWEQKLFISDITGIIDMAIHPTNSDIVFAAAWERVRRPNLNSFGGPTSGLYRSLDGGETWNELTTGLPSAGSEKGRISFDIAQSNPNVLYARYANASGAIQGVYRSANLGTNWQEVNSSQLMNVGFHWWFGGIFIDPTDENTVYNVDFIAEKSTDGGNNWSTTFAGVHVDQHALAFNNTIPGGVLLGNDGGLYYSANDGSSYTKDGTLPITQFYRIHVDAQNADKVYAGAQDNGTNRTQTGGIDDWHRINGGDGFQPLVDFNDTNVIYALSQRGNLMKSVNNGTSFGGAMSGIAAGDRKNWDTPIAFDPQDSQTLYYGANRLYKTTNAAQNWSVISPDLTNGPHTGNLTFGTIISISPSSIHNDLIYVGTDDGNVWKTENAGGNWDLLSASLPDRWVTSVLASRDDIDEVYVTLSGYRYGEDEGHVYKSVNGGQSWTDISTGLPDIPINDIVKDRYGNLILATDVGVFISGDEGANWEVLGDNLPSVVVTDMYIHEASEFLYVATYGRSSYKIDISNNILGVSEEDISEVLIYPNPASEKVSISIPNTSEEVSIVLYDALGREVKRAIFNQNYPIELPINTLSKGIYYLNIRIGNSETTKKLLKK